MAPGGAVWTVGRRRAWWAQLAGLLAAALVVLPLPWRARLLALPLALALLAPPASLPGEGSFDLVAADVGAPLARPCSPALTRRAAAANAIFVAGRAIGGFASL